MRPYRLRPAAKATAFWLVLGAGVFLWGGPLVSRSAEARSPATDVTGRRPAVRSGLAPIDAPFEYYLPVARRAYPVPALTEYDWLQFGMDPGHSANNTLETWIGFSTVSQLHRLFQVSLPSIADGAPAFLVGVSTSSGTKDLVFVTTKAGHIIALDAHTGAQVWIHQYGPNGCVSSNGGGCYTTSSPAIDPSRQYVYSYGLDGYVHKYAVGDGTETTTGGWPELTTHKGNDEKGSSALSFATASNGHTYLYVTHAGYPGDRGDYQGHITTIDLADGSQHVFNAECSDQTVHFVVTPGSPDCSEVQSAVWARPGVIYDADTDRIYAVTGNGTFSAASHGWGDTVFALNPDGTDSSGNPIDSYTPTNFQALDDNDEDLGSTAPAILPTLPGSSIAHLAVQSGKDGELRLINLDDLSGQGGVGHTGGQVQILAVPQGGEVLTQPAVWTNPNDGAVYVFVTNDNGISALKLSVNGSGTPSLSMVWKQSAAASSPVIANQLLYVARGFQIRALDPLSGTQMWSDASIGGIHWESPIVASGILYITDENQKLTAYTIP
ncbi:MAG: PQQ-binding-like beta-propeller repeat protein [Chloroflexi bacterium]|nr:PQQ-binding-like beta-propeller repeat protein [Chloroflexota bacterium]